MTMQVTVRFESTEAVERAQLAVLTADEEALGFSYLVGGFYYTTDKTPVEVFAAFHQEGFVDEDFESIQFSNFK